MIYTASSRIGTSMVYKSVTNICLVYDYKDKFLYVGRQSIPGSSSFQIQFYIACVDISPASKTLYYEEEADGDFMINSRIYRTESVMVMSPFTIE